MFTSLEQRVQEINYSEGQKMYTKKSYCYKTIDGAIVQRVFSGHITRATAIKHNFESVTLSIYDGSGKGRGEDRRFYAPDFSGMSKFN